jgi:exonuclease SbcD
VTVVELREKGDVTVRTLPLIPRRDLRELRGRYDQLTLRSFYETQQTGDYLHITLTDEQDIPDAIGKLRVIYSQLMKLDYDNARTRAGAVITGTDAVEQKSPLELFDELYEKQNNQPMSDQQRQFAAELIRDIWEETP